MLVIVNSVCSHSRSEQTNLSKFDYDWFIPDIHIYMNYNIYSKYNHDMCPLLILIMNITYTITINRASAVGRLSIKFYVLYIA